MGAVKAANDVLAFLLELAALAALMVWGIAVGPNWPTQIALGIGAPVVMIVVWGLWLAPRSERRLEMPWLVIAKVVVLGLATAALAVAGPPELAVILGVLVVLNLGLTVLWG